MGRTSHRHGPRRLAGLAATPLLAAALWAAPASAATLGSVTTADGVQHGLGADDTLVSASGARPAARFTFTRSGAAAGDDSLVLSGPTRFTVRYVLRCSGTGTRGGALLVYGTAGQGIARVDALLSDGSRRRIGLQEAPTAWRYRGRVVARALPTGVGILEVRTYDTRGRRLSRTNVSPEGRCLVTLPPPRSASEAEDGRRGTDPSILDGTLAERLVKAERTWRRLDIDDYDFRFESRFSMNRSGPSTVRVRNGRTRSGPTVEALFARVRDAILDRPDELSVTFDARGVPRTISENPRAYITDLSSSSRVTSFRRR